MTEQVNISGPVNKRWRIVGEAKIDGNVFYIQQSFHILGFHICWLDMYADDPIYAGRISFDTLAEAQKELERLLHKPITTIYQIKES